MKRQSTMNPLDTPEKKMIFVKPAAVTLLILLSISVMWTPLRAESPDQRESLTRRVFTIKNKSIEDVILLVNSKLSKEGSLLLEPGLERFTVEDREGNLERIAKIIAEYDIPPRNIEVAIKLVKGSTTEAGQGGKSREIQKEIQSLSAQLRGYLKFTDYHLLGSVVAPATEGQKMTLLITENFRIEFKVTHLHQKRGIIRLEEFTLSQKKGGKSRKGVFTPIIKTTFNLRNNQPLILSASRMEKSKNALFITIYATIRK